MRVWAIGLPFLVIFFFSIFVPPKTVFAKVDCGDRYVTIVNPVRDRERWFDKSLAPIEKQYSSVEENGLRATWLIQYDALKDKDLIEKVKGFKEHEKGLLLEISKKQADEARVIYDYKQEWFYPQAIFLSGYKQSERRRLIDKAFLEYKNIFGEYPKSVGAWWIDSYSLNYLKTKYQIKAVLIVADQLSTDAYGVWGQWWGVPYYPSKQNILIPAASLDKNLDVVVLQWAQRDPILAYGDSPLFSNYSLQGNDYIRQGKDTEYFKSLANYYLDCKNPIGQITVGLETGIEGFLYHDEFENQMRAIKEMKINSVTMSEFYDKYKSVYPNLVGQINLGIGEEEWKLNIKNRENKKLGDFISYEERVSFSDYFTSDNNRFLDRNLTKLSTTPTAAGYFPWQLVFLGLIAAQVLFKKRLKFLIVLILFWLSCYGLIIRSYSQYGWEVYFGPVYSLQVLQLLAVFLSFNFAFLIYKLSKYFKNEYLLLTGWLVFGMDIFFYLARVSFIEGKYYIGFLLDAFRFVGIASDGRSMQVVNRDFEAYLAEGLLRMDINIIWENLLLSLIGYPLIHILVAILLGELIKKAPKYIKLVMLVGLFLLWGVFIIYQFDMDPRVVMLQSR